MEAQEEKPDIFTVSVGNIPPGADVLIKITYVTELSVDGADIVFSVPAALAPPTETSAPTQTDVKSVKVTSMMDVNFSLQAHFEMPYEIVKIDCSAPVRIKQVRWCACLFSFGLVRLFFDFAS